MNLRSVYISHYKNLKDFKIVFDKNDYIIFFVGKNGSGKSNFFEALTDIFRHLYEYDNSKEQLEYDYCIEYTIDAKQYKIEWKEKEFRINSKIRKTIGSTTLPDNLFIYYSGHNEKIINIVKTYETKFKSKVKKSKYCDSRKIIGIDQESKQLLLSSFILKSNSKSFVYEKLGIKSVSDEIILILKRPFFNSNFEIDLGDINTYFWGAEGQIKNFLERLSTCVSEGPIREEGYIASRDQYILYLSIMKIQKEFKYDQMIYIYRMLDSLKIVEMLERLDFNINLTTDEVVKLDQFSDGQYQSVYINSISEIFMENDSITLLDEPDSFLHPEWQFDFLDQVHRITDPSSNKNQIFLSSHSAVTIIPHKKKKVKFFEIKDKRVICFDLKKNVAIKKLSSNLIHYSEQEKLLSIINTIQIEKKPIVFTEGHTDPIILTEAWEKLFEEEIPFIPFYAFSCTYISQLLTDQRIHAEMEGLPIFALFDFDKAYNQWVSINGEVLEDNLKKGIIKKWSHGKSYALMIPIPEQEDIKKQVYKDEDKEETFGGDSFCEIEHLFYGIPGLEKFYKKERCVGGERIAFISDSQKVKFAKKIVPTLNSSHFEIFLPLFNFIREQLTV